MKIALIACPGLFADAMRHVLSQLASSVVVERYDFAVHDFGGVECDFAVADVDAARPRKPAVAIRKLLAQLPNTPIVALGSQIDQQAIAAVIQAGAAGYVAKSFGENQALGVLRVALDKAGVTSHQGSEAPGSGGSRVSAATPCGRNGRPYGLTPREMEVLALLLSGMFNKEIANRLGIVVNVVRVHLHHAYQKLGVRSRVQALPLVQAIDELRQLQVEGAGDAACLRKWLLPHMWEETKRKGEMLFRKGDPGRALYFINKGRLRLLELRKIVGEGELLGEIAVFSPKKRRTCSAQCETEVRLFSLEADRARKLFFANPQFAFYLMQLAAERLSPERDPIQ
jgi:DNA-binding NarL/FixJ family response regulator